MNLKTIFLFAVLVSVGVNAKLCNKERISYCKGVKRVNHCLHLSAEECNGKDEINQEIKETRRKLLPIEEMCFKKEQVVPINMEQCARSLQKELNRCATDSVDEVLGRKIAEHSLYKIRCSIYNFIFKCIVQKDNDSCGKEAGQAALELMFDLPAEIQENCGNSVINGTLRELAYDTGTEKSYNTPLIELFT